jgi:isopenicillin N synthase-like dioxygenase
MAVLVPTKSTEHGFSISKIISRFRSKKRTNPKPPKIEASQQETRPPLIPSPLPLVLPEHQQILPNLGWTTITFPQPSTPPSPSDPPGPHPLQLAYESLFQASQAFFNLSADQKNQWKHKLGSEEGWSSIPGEKEFITLRTLEYCPDILRESAKRYWDLMGAYLEGALGRIGTSLALGDEITRFIGPCGTMQDTDAQKTATMLRLFRYEGWDAKVVAEPHSDLGLLSVVVGDVPGLEVWDGHAWFDVEREVERSGKRGASLLVGRQLEKMSNGRYGAGGHRVVSYGATRPAVEQSEKRYRFSIVFVLRAHEPVIVDSEKLETEVTGKWEEPMKGVTAGEMYEEIRGRHYNINIGVEEREKQRKKIKEQKEKIDAA